MSKSKRKRKSSKPEKNRSNRNIYIISVFVLLLAGYWGLIQFSEGTLSNYPDLVAGVFYSTPLISTKDGSFSIPADFLEYNKMVFLDLELDEPKAELIYLDRVIPLEWYGDGKHLPVVVISTPKGNTFAGIRVCEPCGSFGFHIVERKYLQCDACGTRWEIEDFSKGVGGCADFPPPLLSVTVGQDIEVNLAETGLQLLA